MSAHRQDLFKHTVEYIQTKKINLRTFKIYIWTYNCVYREIKNE